MIELFDHLMLPLAIGSEKHVEIETGRKRAVHYDYTYIKL